MKISLFSLGFRPFFLLASIYAVISILIWILVYSGQFNHSFSFSSPVAWHGHEMIFGYAMAVIAGFLLTAVKNWTGITTINGFPLLLLVLFWLCARILGFVSGDDFFVWNVIFDSLFLFLLSLSLAIPIIKAGNWKSLAIVTKILLILGSNIVFYLGVSGIIEDGERMGLYSALYLVLALMLTLARRVMPFFIEGGVGYAVELKNWIWIDRSSLILFLLFWLAEIFMPNGKIVMVLAAMLFILHSIRLSGWHTHGIWKQPLLWSLFFAYGFLTLGFLLKAVSGVIDISPYLAVHAFTYGGIAMMSLGMMARVSLGHTGRNVYASSKVLFWIFLILSIGAVIRVIFPLVDNTHYLFWIQWSSLHWLLAFALFVFVYTPKLIMARVDGKPG